MIDVKQTVVAILCVTLVASCGDAETPAPTSKAPESRLLIGLVPEYTIFDQIQRYEPLAAYLSAKIGVRIRLKVLSSYGEILHDFDTKELDGAFFGSFAYALVHERVGVLPVARPINPDASSSYHGLIFVRRDSGIRTIAEMRGKRFAFVDKLTTAGYLLPLDYFQGSGVGNYESYFAETYFTGTHEAAINDVLRGRADIGAAKNTVFANLAARDPRVARDLVVLAHSPAVPENALALRGDIDESVRSRLKETLLNMSEEPEGRAVLRRFGALGFVETTNRDYEPVYRYARQLHLDLTTYDPEK